MAKERSNELGSILSGNVNAGPTTDRYLLIEAAPDQEFSLTAAAAAGDIGSQSAPGEIVSLLVVRVVQQITIDRRGEPKERKPRKIRRQVGEGDDEYNARVAAAGAEAAGSTKESKPSPKKGRGPKPKPEPGEEPADFERRLQTWKDAGKQT